MRVLLSKLLPGLVVTAIACLLCLWGGVATEHRVNLEWQTKWAEKDVQLQTARAEAAERELKAQQETAAEIDRINQAHDQAMAEMQHDAAADRVTADGLRADLASLRAKLQKQASGPGQQVDYATKASMVLSDLYESCTSQRRDLAESLEGAGIQLRTIAAQYERIRGQ
jgi:hypothetical protein